MLSYCVTCGNTKTEKPKISKSCNVNIMLLSKSAMNNSKKLRFAKEYEAGRFLS